jgi:hypothetical protein
VQFIEDLRHVMEGYTVRDFERLGRTDLIAQLIIIVRMLIASMSRASPISVALSMVNSNLDTS